MADHGLTGTHHIDGSLCYGQEDERGNTLIDCTWSASAFMGGAPEPSYAEAMATPQMQEFVAHVMKNASNIKRDAEYADLELEERKRRKRLPPRPGTFEATALTCGCAIPWEQAHTLKDVLICATHGITVIDAYR